jgi:hypothetical protein
MNIPNLSGVGGVGTSMVNNFHFNVSGNIDKSTAANIVEQVSTKFKIMLMKNGQLRSI